MKNKSEKHTEHRSVPETEVFLKTAAEMVNRVLDFNITPELVEKRREMFGKYKPEQREKLEFSSVDEALAAYAETNKKLKQTKIYKRLKQIEYWLLNPSDAELEKIHGR